MASFESRSRQPWCFFGVVTSIPSFFSFVLLQVFTSASTIVFKTFACDGIVVEGERYLREDYRLSCDSSTHTYFMIYAGVMIAVSSRQQSPL